MKILGVDLSDQTVSVPCLKALPASKGPISSEDAEIYLSIDRRMGGEQGCFMVKAGSSDLAVLGVAEGDFVLIGPAESEEIDDGAIVVARVGDTSSYHRFTRNGKGVYLESLRPGGDRTLIEDPADVRVIGRVTAFYRRMDEAASVNLTQH